MADWKRMRLMMSALKVAPLGLLTLALFGGHAARAQTEGTRAMMSVKASQRAQLLARVEPSNVKLGSQVAVSLTLTNVSADTIRVTETFKEQDYEILVVDSSGKEVKRTDFGRRLFEERKDFRRILVLLNPGEKIEVEVEITKIYELTEPKTYYVRVMRTLLPESDEHVDPKVVEKAISNPVAFTVLE